MSKILVITGKQATGKTLLGYWLNGHTSSRVDDEVNLEYILSSKPDEYPQVFITNEELTYKDLDKDKYLIIRLCEL
jgi:hypothetical protein